MEINVNENKLENNHIDSFQFLSLKDLSVEELKEKVPELLNEVGDGLDIERFLNELFNIIKSTTKTANRNRWSVKELKSKKS